MALPSRLYKYQPPSIQALTNLASAKLWFSSPTKFNDPFDCAIEAVLEEIQEDESVTGIVKRAIVEYSPQIAEDVYREANLEQVASKVAEDIRRQMEGKCDAEEINAATSLSSLKPLILGTVQKVLLDEGHTYIDHKEMAKRLSLQVFARVKEVLASVRGVCCFSEVVDDLLMWGHYGDCHRGYCLEFDTSKEPFDRARPVQYSDELPKVKADVIAKSLGLRTRPDSLFELVLTKPPCWRYEKEWRILHTEADLQFGYDRALLTGVYFGAKMPEDHQSMIAALLANTETKLYRMNLSKSHFKLEHEVVTFTPTDYRSDGIALPQPKLD